MARGRVFCYTKDVYQKFLLCNFTGKQQEAAITNDNRDSRTNNKIYGMRCLLERNTEHRHLHSKYRDPDWSSIIDWYKGGFGLPIDSGDTNVN